MKTIILPGYSEYNREWAFEIREKMGLPDVTVHEWGHWKGGSFSLEKEVGRIIREIGEVRMNIIAKSVGTSVAMELLQKIPEQINKLILCGIPVNGFEEERKELFRSSLLRFPVKNIVVFQNKKDNLGAFKRVSEFIHSINPGIKVEEKPRSDHNYPYASDFKNFLDSSLPL